MLDGITLGYLFLNAWICLIYVPEEEKIAWTIRRLRQNRPGVPSGMQAEHLRSWPAATNREDSPDETHWRKVVLLIQAELRDGNLPE